MPVTLTCEECGDEFEVPPSHADRHRFCSRECLRQGLRVTKTCPTCDEEFSVKRSHAESRVHCSAECNPRFNTEATDCPTCGETFNSLRSMRGHHSRVHNEPLGTVTLECAGCGDEFTTRRDRADTREYCSRACQTEDSRVTLTCDQCGEEFSVKQSHSDRRFCDKDCTSQWRSETYRGKNHPSWEGGYGQYYGANWPEKRAETLKRDNYECQCCGLSNPAVKAAFGRELSVHHVTSVREFDDPADSNFFGNLIALCELCHHRVF